MGTHSLESQVELTEMDPGIAPPLEDKNLRTLFLRNVDYNATEDDLRQIPEFQTAMDIKIPTDKDTGRPRGYGFIEYKDSETCKAAMHQLSQGGPIQLGEYVLVIAQSQAGRGPGQQNRNAQNYKGGQYNPSHYSNRPDYVNRGYGSQNFNGYDGRPHGGAQY